MTLGRNWRRLPWYARYRVGGELASRARKVGIQLTHLHCRVEFGSPVYLGPGFRLIIPDGGTLIVGPGTQFRHGFVCEIGRDGRVVIGPNCTFTSHALVQCSTSIEIGQGCTFGQDTLIVDGNHRFRDWNRPLLEQDYDFRPVRIDDDALITSKVSIIGADIGRRAVIGANSVVTGPIPAYSLAVGSPARVIEYFGPPDEPAVLADGEATQPETLAP